MASSDTVMEGAPSTAPGGSSGSVLPDGAGTDSLLQEMMCDRIAILATSIVSNDFDMILDFICRPKGRVLKKEWPNSGSREGPVQSFLGHKDNQIKRYYISLHCYFTKSWCGL